MRRLIEKGLMFGNLIEVASPALIERYNRALEHLTGKRTGLEDFHVDISGYSPEVGHELGDHLYLNQNGVNRQFILLTTEQKTAPLLNAKFSTSRGILRQFIEENEAQLFALTARDAVAGELVNSVYSVETPVKLFDIRKVVIEADTTQGTVRQAEKLGQLVDRFQTEEDAWFDDVLIAEMIGMAKATGDVTRNPVKLKKMEFEQANFWTAHFGGLYVFRGMDHPAVIASGDKTALGPLPIKYYDGVNSQPNTAYAAAVSVTVSPGLIGRMQSPAGKAVLFVLGLAFFWGLVMLVRRARRSKAEQPAKAIPVPDRQDWDALAARARETPDGKFYADLEAAVWDEMFQLTHPQEGTSSTRLAALQNDGVPESAIAKLRQVVGQCEKNRHVDGPQSQGDAIEAVNQARAAVSEARDALLPAPEAAGRSDAPNAHND